MTVGILVHDIGSREIRVKFDVPVYDAENIISYTISSISGHVPSIIDVSYYDSDNLSVSLKLDSALTNGEIYSCQVLHLKSYDGRDVTINPFEFVSTDDDRPKILRACLSERGYIDIICDRNVALTSLSASASIKIGAFSDLMVLVPWHAGQSNNAVRFFFNAAPSGTGYKIEYSNIFDISNNKCLDGEIDLSLVHEPSSYADLLEPVVTNAFVADSSNSIEFSTTVLRLYFSCSMLSSDILNQSNWSFLQSGSHVSNDISNSIMSPNASDTPSLITLVNDAKLMINSHLNSHAHVIRDFSIVETPDAIDYNSAVLLVNELCEVYETHYDNTSVHLYADHVNVLLNLSVPINKINDLKSKYNGHILEFYSIGFSSLYSPIGPIINYSSSGSQEVLDESTWFVDLHVKSDSILASYDVGFSNLRSEDLGDSITGSVVIQSNFNNFEILSVTTDLKTSKIKFNCGIESDLNSFRLVDSNTGLTIKSSIKVSSSIPTLVWAFNNLLHSYSMHISDPSVTPYVGAGHKVLDTVNTVSTFDYITSIDLSVIISRANSLKSKIGSHVYSENYHYGKSYIDFPNASDTDSLISLLSNLREFLSSHNSSGLQPKSGSMAYPSILSHHTSPGTSIISANLKDLVMISFDGAIDGNSLNFNSLVTKTFIDNSVDSVQRFNDKEININFIACDNRPTLVSAIPRIGYSTVSPSIYLLTDLIEVYLSKPMRNQFVSIGTNIVISGNPIVINNVGWINDRVMCVQITGMSSLPYSIEAFDIRDFAGNLLTS